jgi:cell division protein FtsL|tara:strand:+ start:12 stop:287 length:276 start_codon:yes stop_codon:yes gene_type:complete
VLALLKKKIIINTLLIISIVSISLLSIHWHHQMYLLHKQEKIVKSDHERINALNRQLMMESSELQSGVTVYQKSKEELLMFSPIESDEVSI